MYAEREEWPLRAAHVDVRFKREGKEGGIARVLSFEGDLDDEQRATDKHVRDMSIILGHSAALIGDSAVAPMAPSSPLLLSSKART